MCYIRSSRYGLHHGPTESIQMSSISHHRGHFHAPTLSQRFDTDLPQRNPTVGESTVCFRQPVGDLAVSSSPSVASRLSCDTLLLNLLFAILCCVVRRGLIRSIATSTCRAWTCPIDQRPSGGSTNNYVSFIQRCRTRRVLYCSSHSAPKYDHYAQPVYIQSSIAALLY